MACLNPDGSLSLSGRRLLAVLPGHDAPAGLGPAELSAATDLPLFRVRGSLREALEGGLATVDDERYRRTARADRLLSETPTPTPTPPTGA